MTKEDRTNEIHDYINYLETVYEKFIGNYSAKIIGFGFSQGVATITRWANVTKKRIDHLVLWAGNPGNELLAENRISNIPIQFILGEKDHFITEEAKIHLNEAFKKAGFNYTSIYFDGGHSVDKTVLQSLKFD
jgi:predicted esterase